MALQIDPYVLKIGFGCNNNCKFCFQNTRTPVFRNSLDLKKELAKVRMQGYVYIVFEGGEPTIRKDILGLIRYARGLGFKQIDIQSNGRLFFYEEVCRNFIESGINMFTCSLQSHKKEMHDFLTSTPGSFEETVAGIKNLKRLKQTVANQTVINKINYISLPKIISFLIDLNLDKVQLNFIQPIGQAENNFNLLVPRLSEVIPYVRKAIGIAKKKKKYIGTMGIPCCILGEYSAFAQEYKRAKKGADPQSVIFKSKNNRCRDCSYDNVCEGPWSSYVKYFGWEEFRPR